MHNQTHLNGDQLPAATGRPMNGESFGLLNWVRHQAPDFNTSIDQRDRCIDRINELGLITGFDFSQTY